MENENKNLNQETENSAPSYGYCPYTEDRNCYKKSVGGFDDNNESCRKCSNRAW